MQTLTIAAASRESAIGFYAALEGFRCHLHETEAGYRVEIQLRRGDRDIVDLLGALAQYVREREDGPAQIALDGRAYTVHPTD
jgi:hypothetical protein